MKKYTLHFRQTDAPFAYMDKVFTKNAYGEFDYRVLQKDNIFAGFLSKKGLTQAYNFGKQLLNEKFAKKIILDLKKFNKRLQDHTLLIDIESLKGKDLIKRWKIINKINFLNGHLYRYCEQPMLVYFEKIVLKSAKNQETMIKVLNNPKLAKDLNFSEKSYRALILLIKLGHLKFLIHSNQDPWVETIYIFAKLIAKNNFLSLKQALMIRASEMENALNNKIPTIDTLNARLKGFILIPSNKNKEFLCLAGKRFVRWQKKLECLDNSSEIKGIGTFPGKIIGKVKIHLSLTKSAFIPEGTVLVSGMTNPKIVPMLKNAKAIVTDEGGLTCHAAIISRELKIPAVVGTGIATQVLKDGDMVEVDADNGIVKILKNSN